MRSSFFTSALFALTRVEQSAAVETRDLLEDLQSRAIQALKEKSSNAKTTNGTICTLENSSTRQDW
jgi:tyrosinase